MQASQQELDETVFRELRHTLVNSRMETYDAFRKTLFPRYHKVWLDIFLGWLCIAICLVLAALVFSTFKSWWVLAITILSAAISCGYCIAFLLNFFHEAAHFNIAKKKSSNDTLANIFIGILTGQDIRQYRLVHWQHHKHLGSPEDTETSYFEALTPLFILQSLTGVRVIKILTARKKYVTASTPPKKQAGVQPWMSIVFHLLVITMFILIRQWWLIPVWLLAVGTFYPFFNSVRQLLEHRADNADKHIDYHTQPHGKLTRIFGNSFFARSFGSAGFNKHLLHHFEPQISYTRLYELELFLRDTPIGSKLGAQKTSYFRTFLKFIRQK
ncbi:fatty acid desaturase family protein [Ferruginibacter sp.]